MAFPNVDRFCIYNFAVQFCQEVLKQSGPQHYLNLFQSLLNKEQFAPSFKYFTKDDAYNFFLCYPQVFTINDSFVSLNIQPLSDIQPSINIQSDFSNFIYEIRENQTKASEIKISQKSKNVHVREIYEDAHKKFSSSVSEITEIPESVKKNLVYSVLFLLRCFQTLNLKCAFKTVLYIDKNVSSNFLDLSETKKQMFLKAMCKVLQAKFPGKCRPYSFINIKKSVLLFATYLLTERRKMSFNTFSKLWEKLSIQIHFSKYQMIKNLRESEFIVVDKMNSLSLSPSFEPVNFIVESYSELILQISHCENCSLNQNEQEVLHLSAMDVDSDIQSTDPSYHEENYFNSSKALNEVQMLSLQSNQEEETKSIKKEQNLSRPMRASTADNIGEITAFKGTVNEYEASEKTQIMDKMISLDENEEKLLEHSFFIIRRYFEDALPNHIILSFLLASKNVCENFAILCVENQWDYLKRCYCSINTYGSSQSDSNYHKLKESTLVDERVCITCYLVVKLKRIHYINVINFLNKIGINVQEFKNNALGRMYFKSICNYVNFSKKGFLNLKAPFSRINRSPKNFSPFSQNYAHSYVFPNHSTKDLHEVQTLNLLSNWQEKPKSIKKEQDLLHLVRMSKADNIEETIAFKGTGNKDEASEKTQMMNKKFSFDNNGERLLEHSFFIIRRYFEDALPNHIILSFLLASKNVCENFATLSIEDQCVFLEKCYSSINNIYGSYPSDSNYHKLMESTLVEERICIICYVVVKSGGIHYTNLIKLLKNIGICVEVCKDNVGRMYLKDICKYVNFSKKGFLTLKPPFSGIKRSLTNVSDFSQNHASSNAFSNHSTETLCEVQMLSSQSNQEEKPKSINEEQELPHSMGESKADNFEETTPFKGTGNKHYVKINMLF